MEAAVREGVSTGMGAEPQSGFKLVDDKCRKDHTAEQSPSVGSKQTRYPPVQGTPAALNVAEPRSGVVGMEPLPAHGIPQGQVQCRIPKRCIPSCTLQLLSVLLHEQAPAPPPPPPFW